MKYKVITSKVKDAEELMNQYAKDGWEVAIVTPNMAMGFGLVITFKHK